MAKPVKSVSAYACNDGTLVVGLRKARLYNHRLETVFPVLADKVTPEFAETLRLNLALVEELLATRPEAEADDEETGEVTSF